MPASFMVEIHTPDGYMARDFADSNRDNPADVARGLYELRFHRKPEKVVSMPDTRYIDVPPSVKELLPNVKTIPVYVFQCS